MCRSALLGLLFWLPALLSAQTEYVSGLSTRWNDSFGAWEVFCVTQDTTTDPSEWEEAQCGSLQLRWLNMRDDWSEWDYEIHGKRGIIRQKWKDDPSEWELRTFEGEVVTMRTLWRNDLKQWRITNNDISLHFRTRWTNQLDEWRTEEHTRGQFYVYTLYRNDPRDWSVRDEMTEDVPETMKLAMLFLAVFHGTPRM